MREFDAKHCVRLQFDFSDPDQIQELALASALTVSEDRRGRARRTLHAGRGEVVWEFENPVDAVFFKLRYG